MAQANDRQRDSGVRIALIGPHPAVRLMQNVAREMLGDEEPAVRTVNAPLSPTDDAREHYRRVSKRVDAVLFAGQLQFDRARAGEKPIAPAAFVAGTETSLYAALVRATLGSPIDLARVSVDSLTRDQVDEAYVEVGIDSAGVAVAPYGGPESVEDFTRFHLEAHEKHTTQLALTTRTSVARELKQLNVPVETIQPTRGTIRDGLERAISIASRARLGDQQIAFAFVQLLTDGERGPGVSPANWEQEAALSLHRVLLEDARRVDGVVTRRSDLVFAVTTTHGGLDELTQHLRIAPFVGTVRQQLGLPVAVGLGTGRTAAAAETNAGSALAASIAVDGASIVHVGSQGVRTELAAGSAAVASSRVTERERDIAARLSEVLGEAALDVDDVSKSLGVTTRTGHRMLTSLVEAGLAWPLPPQSASGGGRPRKRYRLLEQRADSS